MKEGRENEGTNEGKTNKEEPTKRRTGEGASERTNEQTHE